MSNVDVEEFLEHFGVKGMRWGVRRAQKKAAKAEKRAADYAAAKKVLDKINAQERRIVNKVIKDIGSRNPMELYVVGTNNRRLMMTGEEFVQRASMGMRFTSINSSGMMVGRPKTP